MLPNTTEMLHECHVRVAMGREAKGTSPSKAATTWTCRALLINGKQENKGKRTEKNQ